MNSQVCPEFNCHILWWGRSDLGYSRNRILRQGLQALGCQLSDFRPRMSRFADLEASICGVKIPDIIWVPCFRQRDVRAAVSWGQKHQIPVLFDPLISAYDKQVDERGKLVNGSRAALRLLKWERQTFNAVDVLLADTSEHKQYFHDVLQVPMDRIIVVPVGAEDGLFRVARKSASMAVKTVLFYGSYLHLQGPEVIVQAAKKYKGPPVRWQLVGSGPLLEKCRRLAANQQNIEFRDFVPYERLPEIIQEADILLGVFGTTPKASRVIPNKVFQALACGKPLITRAAPAYPAEVSGVTDVESGIAWVEPGNADHLAAKVAELLSQPKKMSTMGLMSRRTYDENFSQREINVRLMRIVSQMMEIRRNE